MRMFEVVVGRESLAQLGPLPTQTQGGLEEGPFRSGGNCSPLRTASLRSVGLGAERTAWEPVCQPV